MELKEFIEKVLLDVTEAVEAASQKAKRTIGIGGRVDARSIEFDIAVTVEDTSAKSGKAEVRVLQFAEAGGDMSIANKNSTVSRINFGVNVDAWTKEERKEHEKREKETSEDPSFV